MCDKVTTEKIPNLARSYQKKGFTLLTAYILVFPNCYAIIHRRKNQILTIDDVKKIYKSA